MAHKKLKKLIKGLKTVIKNAEALNKDKPMFSGDYHTDAFGISMMPNAVAGSEFCYKGLYEDTFGFLPDYFYCVYSNTNLNGSQMKVHSLFTESQNEDIRTVGEWLKKAKKVLAKLEKKLYIKQQEDTAVM